MRENNVIVKVGELHCCFFLAVLEPSRVILAKSPNPDFSQMTAYCSDSVCELTFGTQSLGAMI